MSAHTSNSFQSRFRRAAIFVQVRAVIVVFLAAVFSAASHAQPIIVNLAAPAIDRWNYPFAGSPGGSTYAAVFAPLTTAGFDSSFDNRDGQLMIGFNTLAAGVPAGLGPRRYTVNSAAVLLMVETGGTFIYDPTPDPWQSWLGAGDPDLVSDSDPGHAVEIFGTRYRNGFTSATYTENVAYSPVGPFGKGVRSAYPVTLAGGRCRDVSNNVDQRFEAQPFGVGLNPAIAPGSAVPLGSVLRFQLDVANSDIQRWLARALSGGRVDFSVASIFPSQQQTTGGYPRFYCKEDLNVLLNIASAARLEMLVSIAATSPPAGDIDRNGQVDVTDLLAVISAWGDCPCCPADVNFDDVVNVSDLLTVIADWG